jgi:hypothetical protein
VSADVRTERDAHASMEREVSNARSGSWEVPAPTRPAREPIDEFPQFTSKTAAIAAAVIAAAVIASIFFPRGFS